jgi:hypothetical protein
MNAIVVQTTPDNDGLSGQESACAIHLARRYLIQAHKAHPGWSVGDLLRELGLPETPWLMRTVEEIGFYTAPSDELCDSRILHLYNKGVWSDRVISDETGIPLPKVKMVIDAATGFGSGAFGSSPYGGSHTEVSDGKHPAVRRVTIVGQMSYRRHIYSLGIRYRGRIASLIERGPALIVMFGDRPCLHLAARHVVVP